MNRKQTTPSWSRIAAMCRDLIASHRPQSTSTGSSRIIASLAAVACMLSFLPAAALAQTSITVPNSGFETPTVSPASYQTNPTGGSWSFANYSGISANGSSLTSSNANAPQGSQVAFLVGTSSFSQTFSSLTIGSVYTVTFSAAIRNVATPAQTWDLRVDNVTKQSFNPGTGATSYVDYTGSFTATNTSHAISFVSTLLNGGDVTQVAVFIDNVRITTPGGVPSAPSGLTATAAGNTQINLTWTDNSSNETGFKIERKTGSGGTYAQIATPAANATSYSNTGLAASTQYYYRIRSYNASGDSSYSTEANATTTAGPPPNVPSGLAATVISTSQINLAWTDNSNNENLFKIQRKTGSGGTYSQVGVTFTNQNTYSDTGLSTGTTYYYRVVSNNTNGDSAPSNEVNATTLSGSGPNAPSGTTASAVSSSQINVSWTDNSSNENIFKIQRKTGSGGTYSQIGIALTNVTTYSDTGLTASTTYYYRVVANNTNGDSAPSNETNATTQSSGTVPATPTGLSATAASTSQINLAWTDASSNETGFKVERKTGSGGTYSEITTTAANATSYSSTGLAAATQYYYRVRATNGSGNSSYSNEANATTQSTGPTGTGLTGEYFPNDNLVGSPTLTRTDATIDFTWHDSPGAGVPGDQFSVRWTGQVQPQYSETYTFYDRTDDGSRLWVNGVQLINDWTGHGPTEYSGTITLVAGQKYDIVMEYFEFVGDGNARLSWSSPSTAKAVIPQLRLYPVGGVPPVGSNALYQITVKYWDGYGGNYASTYIHVAAPGGPANNAPVIGTVTASPSSVAPSGTVNLSASATDADGDPLQYFWVVPAGQVGWSKAANDTWKAPTIGGTYSLQVMVSDGKTWVSKWVDVFVNGNGNNVTPGNHIASITSLKPNKTSVVPNEAVSLVVTQTDPDPTGLWNYVWWANGGSINGAELSGNTNTWTAPNSIGSPRDRVVKPGYILWPRSAPDQATCPFPLSTAITGIGLTGRCSRQHISDTWMPSWGQDNSLFSPWQDGGILTPPFNTLPPNNPTDNRHGWAKLEGDDPMDLMTTHAGVTTRPTVAYGTFCYPGAAFTKDGVYYYGLRNFRIINNAGNPSTWEDGVARLFPTRYLGFNVSTDGGATWTMCPHSEASPLINEPDPLHCKFGQLQPVDFGKNMQYSPDGKVYFVSNGSLTSDSSVDPLNDDHIYLCRATVSVSGINNIANWEFYGSGTWKTAANNGIADATPIATWENHFTGVSVVYNPGLNKYLLIGNKGQFSKPTSTTIHLEDDDTFILESSSLTGPWNMAMYWLSFGTQAYYGNIPSKFIAADGKTAWLWYGANFELGVKPEDPFGSGYRLTQQQIRFLTAADQ